jgi:tetratricopeptide (TPR) repeat protein
MLHRTKLKISHGGVLLIFFFSCYGFGCSQVQKFPGFLSDESRYDSDKAALQKGNEAFQNGDYHNALEIYRTLSQMNENPETRRKALYGLACTMLILSKKPNDLDKAIILWDEWSKLAPPEIMDEDPRMLRQLLLDKAFQEKMKKKLNAGKEMDQNINNSELVKTRDNKILQLQNQLKIMESKIEALKHQISSLEEIDQNIFEKKKDISTHSN